MSRQLLPIACILLFVTAARAEEDDLRSLELYNGSQVDTVSVGRSLRPASQTAENITVVTAKDIEAINAHTLVDVLNLIAGVQLEYIRTPGSYSNLFLQGSNQHHVLVLIDDVPINNLPDNFPDIGSVPVQMIDRIEIIKGAASTSWGNALGGVINIITKSPQPDRRVSGLASFSDGKASTIDGRGELSGTVNRFGYYLTGGKLRSDGLLPNNMTDLNHFYGKLRYELPNQGTVGLTTSLIDADDGTVQVPARLLNADTLASQVITTLSVQSPLTERFGIEGLLRSRQLTSHLLYKSMTDGTILRDVKDEESSDGLAVKASYLDDLQRVVFGVDYDHLKVHLSQPQRLADVLKRSDDRVGVYLNDTFTLGALSITPSARWDHTEINGDQFSPSFGVTYAVTDNTVLRGYTAKGYSITSLNLDNSLEKVWTSQIGFESADLPYLWLKGTLFRNETWNISVVNGDGSISKQRQLKRGFEVEARTMPVLATSLSLGYTYIDARDSDTDTIVKGIARHTLNLGVRYEDSHHLRVQLTGHYIDWNLDPQVDAQYRDIIWDLYLAKKFLLSETVSVELFGSVRNLFNGEQYDSSVFKNTPRWAEVGVRCAF